MTIFEKYFRKFLRNSAIFRWAVVPFMFMLIFFEPVTIFNIIIKIKDEIINTINLYVYHVRVNYESFRRYVSIVKNWSNIKTTEQLKNGLTKKEVDHLLKGMDNNDYEPVSQSK